jgi:hypothetical protein
MISHPEELLSDICVMTAPPHLSRAEELKHFALVSRLRPECFDLYRDSVKRWLNASGARTSVSGGFSGCRPPRRRCEQNSRAEKEFV